MKQWIGWILLLALSVNSCIAPLSPNQPAPGKPTRRTTQRVELEVLDHVSGTATTLAIQDDYAYVGFSFELLILEVADPSQPRKVAALTLPANDIVVAGSYVYVVGRGGFAVVDAHEPARPTVMSTLALPATASTLALSAEHAYVTVYGDLYTIVLVNPLQPTVCNVTHLALRLTGVAVADRELYVVSNEGFQQLDVTDPCQPRVMTLFADPQLSYGPVMAEGNIYFGGQHGLWRKALALPSTPHLLIPDTVLDSPLDIAVHNGIAYLAGGFQGIHLWDIRHAAAAVEIGFYPTAGLMRTVVAQGNTLYAVDCDEGVRIFDVTEPDLLQPLAAFTPLGVVYDVAVNGDYAYVAAGFHQGLHQVALADPAQIHIAAHLTAAPILQLATAGDKLYLIQPGGVGVIDLANPTTPRSLAVYPLPDAAALAVAEPYLYVSDRFAHLWVLDGSDPTHLVGVADYPDGGYADGMAVADGVAYLPHTTAGLRILSVGPHGELSELGRYATEVPIHQIVAARGYLYLALGEQGVAIIDVSAPAHPKALSRYDTPGRARALALQWPYLVIADDSAGVRVLDVADPVRPVAVAHSATVHCAHQVQMVDNVIYVAQRFAGLWILRLSTP